MTMLNRSHDHKRDLVEKLSDSELLTAVKRLTERERCATAQLIASLMELDAPFVPC